MDEGQSVFIKDGSIVDNIYLAQELFWNYSRERMSAICIMKIDLQKAYTIHWEFVREALKVLDFPHQFI